MVQERLGVVGIASPDVAGRAHHIDSENRYDVAFRSRGAAARHRWSRTFLPARRDVITTSRSCAIRQPSMFQCDCFWGRWANERSRTAPVSHQKRPRQNATNTLELHQNSKKFNEVSCILPLITVWLQVRVLPGPASPNELGNAERSWAPSSAPLRRKAMLSPSRRLDRDGE